MRVAVLEAKGLAASYVHPDGGVREVLRGVDVILDEGETLAVVGPSGCGKTTLLYLLCGLAAPSEGEARLDGEPVRRGMRGVSIILQDYGLLPWKTVLGNAALGLAIAGTPRAEREERARAALLEVGLAGREEDWPGCLSGGEQQRVAIARALAMRPRLLLMDEPFSSLDALTREKLQAVLLDVWARTRVPFVLVTHSVEEAAVLGRRVAIIAGSPATVLAVRDNPGFGRPGHRESPECFELIRAIRADMERLF